MTNRREDLQKAFGLGVDDAHVLDVIVENYLKVPDGISVRGVARLLSQKSVVNVRWTDSVVRKHCRTLDVREDLLTSNFVGRSWSYYPAARVLQFELTRLGEVVESLKKVADGFLLLNDLTATWDLDVEQRAKIDNLVPIARALI